MADRPGIDVEIVDALGGFFRVTTRSGTLDGAIPQRAASCIPFVEGNAAGLHLAPAETFVLHRDGNEGWAQFTDQTADRVTTAHQRALPMLLGKGLLRSDGYWHDRLREGWTWSEDRRVFVWTGLLARIGHDRWLRLGGAFGRRVRVPVIDRILTGNDDFVPVVIETDLSSFESPAQVWVSDSLELACLQPLRPGARFTDARLEDQRWVGEEHDAFYDASYVEERTRKGGIGRYRSLIRHQDDVDVDGDGDVDAAADCQLVYMGPKTHQIGAFDAFADAQGLRTTPVDASQHLAIVEVESPWGAQGIFDGDVLRDIDIDIDVADQERIVSTWRALYGEPGPVMDEIIHRVIHHVRAGEPYLLVFLWLFVVTPPGWSTIIEGRHFPGIDSVRGVVSTDQFHHLTFATRVREGRFEIPRGAPLARAIPVPRNHVHPRLRLEAL